MMKTDVFADDRSAAEGAAAIIAKEARAAVTERGRFVLAVSGGRTPWIMLRALAGEQVPWPSIHLVQVDERVAPAGHADRNLTHIEESLLAHAPIPRENVHAMPVESGDLEAAAKQYALTLSTIAGSTVAGGAVIDLIHLGLGPDGHTASLVPNDAVLEVTNADVGVTGLYQGRRRMTLTYPAINRARKILWLATGAEKREMLLRLLQADQSIPAGRIRQDRAVIVADKAAQDLPARQG